MKLQRLAPLLAVVSAGCGLVNSNTLSQEYGFDPQSFMENFGDPSTMATVPTVTCDPAAATDQCAMLLQPSMLGASTLSCDATSRMCAAAVDVRLPYPIDLSMQQNLPGAVVQYGVDKVSIERIAYWITNNQVNVEIPPIDLYVASAAAKDENDPSAKLVGTVAKLPPKSQCTDAADTGMEKVPAGVSVCDVKLSDAGQSALATFVKDYKTPFQFIAHTKVVEHAGDPLPTGVIAFYVRPWVQFSILK